MLDTKSSRCVVAIGMKWFRINAHPHRHLHHPIRPVPPDNVRTASGNLEKTMNVCDSCKRELLELLDKRIRKILHVAHESRPDGLEVNPDGSLTDIGIAETHCFHLMEIQRILRGEKTYGVYDEYGDPPMIKGPLFDQAHVEKRGRS